LSELPYGHQAWEAADLRFWLHPKQLEFGHARIRAGWALGEHILNWHRRAGKSALSIVLCSEEALRFPGIRIAFFAPSATHAEAIVGDQMYQLLQSAPDHLLPRWSSAEQAWLFQNGSRIEFYSGSVGIRRNLRGLRVHMACVDEARDIPELDSLLKGTIGPALQYAASGGFKLITSTPPDDLDHDFVRLFLSSTSAQRTTMTIDDNTDLDADFIDRAIRDSGGSRSTNYFKREYLCQFIPEALGLVLPMFEAALPDIVTTAPTPGFSQPWTTLDPGGADPTAINAGWYLDDRLHNADERRLEGASVGSIADGLLELGVESCGRSAWIDKGNDILVRSLREHTVDGKPRPIRLIPSPAPDLHGNILQLVELIVSRQLTIDPACVNTIAQCRGARWNDAGTSFRRSKALGHSDNLAALLVAVRSLRPRIDRTVDRREYHRARLSSFVNRLERSHQGPDTLAGVGRRIRDRHTGPDFPEHTILRPPRG
jgi:Terminase large subunit, T4likevirus-type, N-terminal